VIKPRPALPHGGPGGRGRTLCTPRSCHHSGARARGGLGVPEAPAGRGWGEGRRICNNTSGRRQTGQQRRRRLEAEAEAEEEVPGHSPSHCPQPRTGPAPRPAPALWSAPPVPSAPRPGPCSQPLPCSARLSPLAKATYPGKARAGPGSEPTDKK
jgi:hypothetical protein